MRDGWSGNQSETGQCTITIFYYHSTWAAVLKRHSYWKIEKEHTIIYSYDAAVMTLGAAYIQEAMLRFSDAELNGYE